MGTSLPETIWNHYEMTIRERAEAAAAHAGMHSLRALAEACGTSHVWVGKVLSEKSPGEDLLAKIADVTKVSLRWIRDGDPSEAPPWADRLLSIRKAAALLSETERMRLRLDLALTQAEVDHEPEAVAAELQLLRSQRADTTKRLAAMEQAVQAQIEAGQRMLAELRALRGEVEAEPVTARAAAPKTPYRMGDHTRRAQGAAQPAGPTQRDA